MRKFFYGMILGALSVYLYVEHGTTVRAIVAQALQLTDWAVEETHKYGGEADRTH